MTYTSDRTQWHVKEAKSINTSAFGFSLTAMPGFILIAKDVPLLVEEERFSQVIEKRNLTNRERIKLLNNEMELLELYSEFANEDFQLANIGNNHYISMIEDEEKS